MIIKYKPDTLFENEDHRYSPTRKIEETQGILEINGYFFRALSGGWGKGTLPHGRYELKNPERLPDSSENLPYRGITGPWRIYLEPLMYMPDRNGFFLHPDGGIAGTMGCLSPEVGKDDAVWDLLSELLKNNTIILEVY